MEQLALECSLWISRIEAIQASGKGLDLSAGKSEEGDKGLRETLGPYVPVTIVQRLIVRTDGSFELRFARPHVIDVPLEKDPGFIRIKFQTLPIKGRLIETRLQRSGKPVKVLAFEEPHSIGVDRLDLERKSTVPVLGKVLGLLPHIICFILLEGPARPRVAPQFDGMGTKDNERMIRELLKVDDTLLPDTFLPASK